MNGGAWLRGGEHKVDVLLRDLDAVDHWSTRAEQGEFEIDALLGYLAGAPTYLLTAELASCRLLRGDLHPRPFPDPLACAAPLKWRFCRSFSLDYARMQATARWIERFVRDTCTRGESPFEFRQQRDDLSTLESLESMLQSLTGTSDMAAMGLRMARDLRARCRADRTLPEGARGELDMLVQGIESALG